MSRKDQLNALFGLAPAARPAETPAPPAPETKAEPPRPTPAPLGAPNGQPAAAPERVRSGAVGAMGATLKAWGQAERLRDLDPALIDPAPVGDRIPHADDASFAALKASIQEGGQQVPVLVREHPDIPGRFQAAYGHRRIRACRELGLMVRAEIRELDDQSLAVAQGQENIARRDLSFIEKAFFALGLEQAGLPRAAILKALATDKGDLSRYLAVARAAPQPLVWAIGPAPKAGRARWLALTEALARAGWSEGQALPRPLQALLEKQSFAAADSDGRFALALAALARKAEPVAGPTEIRSAEGAVIGRLSDDGNRASLSFAGDAKGFAAFLAAEAPALWRRWRAERGD